MSPFVNVLMASITTGTAATAVLASGHVSPGVCGALIGLASMWWLLAIQSIAKKWGSG